MAELKEYNADEYLHLHIIPHENTFLREECGDWADYLRQPEKYRVLAPKELLKPLMDDGGFRSVLEYLRERTNNFI